MDDFCTAIESSHVTCNSRDQTRVSNPPRPVQNSSPPRRAWFQFSVFRHYIRVYSLGRGVTSSASLVPVLEGFGFRQSGNSGLGAHSIGGLWVDIHQ